MLHQQELSPEDSKDVKKKINLVIVLTSWKDCEILPATTASMHALYTAMLPQTNLQVSLCPTNFVCAPNSMTDCVSSCCTAVSQSQCLLKQFCKWLMENYLRKHWQNLPEVKGAGSLEKELQHSDVSLLVYSKWRMSFTRPTQFIWSSPSQDGIL